MTQEITHRREGRVERWELGVLLVESILLGALAFAGLSRLLQGLLPLPLAQGGGFLLMMVVVLPAIRASMRRRGHDLSVPRYIGFTLLGTVVGILVLAGIQAVS
jgi:hypothetical protein